MANKEFATHLEFKGVRRYFKDSRFEPVTKTSNMTSPVGLDDNGKLWTKEGEGGGGTSDHSQLSNRDAANQHPMSAITGLENEFAQISDAFSDVFEVLDDKLSDAPIDGKQYARKNGAWAVVESGSGSDEAYIVHIMLFNGEYRFEQGGSWGNIIDALYISDKVVVAEVWNGDGDEEQYVYSFGGYGIAPEHGWDLVFYRAEGNQTRYLYIHRDNSISAETVDLDAKFDKSGGQITGNVIASGAVGGSNLYADNGRGAVAIFSAEGTAEHTEAAVANEDGDLAPLLVADPSDDAHAATKYYVDRRMNEKLSDAPSDGKQYARKDGAWAVVESGGGDNNCEVKISYANNTYSADKTRDEIAEAISNGKFVYAVYDNMYYYYDTIDNYFATFKRTFVDVDEVQNITFDIYNDHVLREDITFANVMNVVVEENDGEYTAYLGYVGTETVSFADIEVAINNNRTVVVSFENNKYPLSGFGNDVAQFVNTTINTSMALVEEDVFVITPDGVFRSDSFGQYTKLSVFDALEARVSELEEHGGGTSDHSQLSNRDAANQHPMSAITGLENEFGMIRDTFDGVFNDLNKKLSDAPIDGKRYARKDGAWVEVQSGGGGTSDHSQLTNRDAIDQHPMSAITGLENEFGMVRDTFGDVFSDLNNKLSDAPSDGKQYARKNGVWAEVQSGGGGGADTVITGLYDTYEGTVTLDFPTGTTDYFDYINGLLQQNNDVRIEVDAAWGDWTAVFRHSKTSDDGQGRGYHVFQNSELMDDGSTNAGFLWIDATSVTYVQDDRGVAKTDVNLEHEDRKVSAWTATPNDVNYPTEKLVKDNFDALKAYIDDQFKPHTIWEVEDAEDGITYSSGKSRQLSGSAWKLTGLKLLDNEGKRYARLKFYFRGCVGTVQDQEGAGVVLEMSLDERFRTPRSNLFCATSVGYAINDNGVKAGVVANISVADGWNNAKCATTYTNFNTTGTTALERDYRLYRIEAYKN